MDDHSDGKADVLADQEQCKQTSLNDASIDVWTNAERAHFARKHTTTPRTDSPEIRFHSLAPVKYRHNSQISRLATTNVRQKERTQPTLVCYRFSYRKHRSKGDFFKRKTLLKAHVWLVEGGKESEQVMVRCFFFSWRVACDIVMLK